MQDLVRQVSKEISQVSVQRGVLCRNRSTGNLLACRLKHQNAGGPHLAEHFGIFVAIVEGARGDKGAVQRPEACEEPASDCFGVGAREWLDEVRHER